MNNLLISQFSNKKTNITMLTSAKMINIFMSEHKNKVI
ncbi:hypothetical protein GXM_04468 [Nostoc sphaeroides CCNUC1]|uniref:Uncharacterized protein n=1 Tax=Nostoc sphaeroides CCNUC1 TaxID=2653204 RepID=A0A5P8W2M4_9NOSO|nr:hypothetical protein GXM_04468 [Nostoc sphaeroides CCNUC1]